MQWPIPPFPTRHVYNPRAGGGNGWSSLTTGNPAHTKGSYVTLVPGTTTDAASWAYLNTGAIAASANDTSMIMDIAYGGAGSETIIVSDLMIGFRRSGGFLFPLHVPAGTTVRARLASIRFATTFQNVSIDLYGGEPDAGLTVPGKIATYGVTPASSSGVSITPNVTANVKGSYTELAAATTAPIHSVMVMAQGTSGTLTSFPVYNIDIAVGSAGSETPVIHDYPVETNPSEEVVPYGPAFLPLSLNIPAGVRLSARCSSTAASAAAVEVAVYGFTY